MCLLLVGLLSDVHSQLISCERIYSVDSCRLQTQWPNPSLESTVEDRSSNLPTAIQPINQPRSCVR